MKKEKTVRTYQRRTKSGKVVTVRQHTAKYDATDDLKKMTKKKGAGEELKDKMASKVKVPTDIDDFNREGWTLIANPRDVRGNKFYVSPDGSSMVELKTTYSGKRAKQTWGKAKELSPMVAHEYAKKMKDLDIKKAAPEKAKKSVQGLLDKGYKEMKHNGYTFYVKGRTYREIAPDGSVRRPISALREYAKAAAAKESGKYYKPRRLR